MLVPGSCGCCEVVAGDSDCYQVLVGWGRRVGEACEEGGAEALNLGSMASFRCSVRVG